MAGNLNVNQVQLGDHSDPARNFVFRTNVDGTMTLARGNIGATTQNILQVNAQGVVQVLPQSMIRVNSPNGFGSTNTGRRRFTTVVTNQGSDITYADSATLGASFTINTAGVYAISYTDSFSAAADLGIALNSTATGVPSTLSQIVAEGTTSAAATRACISAQVYLVAGDVVTPFTGGGGNSRAFFTITRVA